MSPPPLFQVEQVELIDKKGYLTISLSLVKEGKILLRKPEGIREWYQDLKVRKKEGKKESLVRLIVGRLHRFPPD